MTAQELRHWINTWCDRDGHGFAVPLPDKLKVKYETFRDCIIEIEKWKTAEMERTGIYISYEHEKTKLMFKGIELILSDEEGAL